MTDVYTVCGEYVKSIGEAQHTRSTIQLTDAAQRAAFLWSPNVMYAREDQELAEKIGLHAFMMLCNTHSIEWKKYKSAMSFTPQIIADGYNSVPMISSPEGSMWRIPPGPSNDAVIPQNCPISVDAWHVSVLNGVSGVEMLNMDYPDDDDDDDIGRGYERGSVDPGITGNTKVESAQDEEASNRDNEDNEKDSTGDSRKRKASSSGPESQEHNKTRKRRRRRQWKPIARETFVGVQRTKQISYAQAAGVYK